MELLDLMLNDMNKAPEQYRPTNFWELGLPKLVEQIKSEGLENFRKHEHSHFFYVPLYGEKLTEENTKFLNETVYPFLKTVDTTRSEGELKHVLSGQTFAAFDYKLLKLANELNVNGSDLTGISESSIGSPIEQFEFNGNKYSKSFLNYLRMLAFLKNNGDLSGVKNVLEIGGGFGTLGEITLKLGEENFYLNVDIPPVSRVSSYYLSEVFGKDTVLTYDESRMMKTIDINEIKKKYRAAVICPWQIEKIKGSFDLFVNSFSFQEMEEDIVCNYLEIVQELTGKYVLLRSSRYGKNVAKKGEAGVLQPLYNDTLINIVNKFNLVKKDSELYGFEKPEKNFFSEVMLFKKK